MFAVAHLDFTLILWPYYIAVGAVYSTVTSLSRSIVPAMVLHTGGNIYSNLDLWLHGRAEWQASSGTATFIWQSGPNRPVLDVDRGALHPPGSNDVGLCEPRTFGQDIGNLNGHGERHSLLSGRNNGRFRRSGHSPHHIPHIVGHEQ
jgi:CAAX prenyl protease-like protein